MARCCLACRLNRKLINVRLHHPVETKVLCEFPEANSITYTNGVVFACRKGDIIFVDVTGKTAVNLQSMRKAKLCDLAKEEDLIPKSSAEKEYTCKQLRDMLNIKLFRGKETSSSRRRKPILTPISVSVQKEINLKMPVCINSFESGILLCEKEANKLMVFAIEIKPRQVQLKLTQSFDFPPCNHRLLPVSVSCVKDDNTAQIRQYLCPMDTKTVESMNSILKAVLGPLLSETERTVGPFMEFAHRKIICLWQTEEGIKSSSTTSLPNSLKNLGMANVPPQTAL